MVTFSNEKLFQWKFPNARYQIQIRSREQKTTGHWNLLQICSETQLGYEVGISIHFIFLITSNISRWRLSELVCSVSSYLPKVHTVTKQHVGVTTKSRVSHIYYDNSRFLPCWVCEYHSVHTRQTDGI